MTRSLNAGQAVQCETAKTKRCRCRCGGLLHGAGRLTTEGEARDLAADDPHHAKPKRQRVAKIGDLLSEPTLDLVAGWVAEDRETVH
jgi:hypothetical protein